MSRTVRLSLRLATAVLGVWLTAMDAASAQDTVRKYQIAEQSLDQALREFALASSLDLLFSPDLVAGRKSQKLNGKFTVDDGLRTLLLGSGLEFSVSGSRIVISRAPESTSQAASPTTVIGGTNGELRLVQAEVSERSPSSTSDPSSARSEHSQSQENRIVLEEIVVTGTNIRGVYPSSSPVQVYTARDIARTGATTTAQFVEKLTQNLNSVTPHGSTSVSSGSVTGIDLRGLGPGTTLVLLNGRRLPLANFGRTADVSLIPAAAIERVEVLTDGASAIYGSDAIGGVVNFVLRDDFDGAETRLSYGGVTSGGMRQMNFTQTIGTEWGSGHGLASYDYIDASSLDRDERSYASDSVPGTLTPDDEGHNLLLTLSQNFGDRFLVSGDIALSLRDVEMITSNTLSSNPLNHTETLRASETEQTFANLGLDYELTSSLTASLLATYSESEFATHTVVDAFNNSSSTPAVVDRVTNYSALDLTAMLNGTLFSLAGGEIAFSIGAGVLDEDYEGANQSFQFTGSEISRRTTYAFAEVFVPLVGPNQNIPLAHRLELSLAGRHTNTDDTSSPSIDREFDDATDPKVGLLWAPTASLNLRGTYGTSFRAPSLFQLDPTDSTNVVIFSGFPVPFPGGPPSTIMSLSGVAPDLDAETAETYTLGFDFRPASHPGFQLSATYYNINYTDRIAPPSFPASPIFTPDEFPEFLTQQPPAAVIEQVLRSSLILFNGTAVDLTDPAAAAAAFAADPNFWILDDSRLRNLSISKQDGLDLTISNRVDTGWGEVTFGAQLTRILDYQQQVFERSPPVTVLDNLYRPADLRGRAFVGISKGGFDGTLNVNYVDDYTNLNAPGGSAEVDSWTTVDFSLAYEFGGDSEGRVFDGLRMSLSVQNLFDEDPPVAIHAASSENVGFDFVNANALGRFIVLGVRKSW